MKSFLILFSALVLFPVTSKAVTVCYTSGCGQLVCNYGCVQKSVNGRCVANYCVGGRSAVTASEAEIDALRESLDKLESGELAAEEASPKASFRNDATNDLKEPQTAEELEAFAKSMRGYAYYCAPGQHCSVTGIVNGNVRADNCSITITGIVNGNLYCNGCRYSITGILNGQVY